MLEARNLCKVYHPKKGKPVKALDNVSVSLGEKGLVFLLGKSGSGKSTLLNLLGGLDSYSSGEIIIKGKSSAKFTQSNFDSYRNTFIGFIFQEFNILEDYSVGRNIGLALELQHKKADKEAIDDILKQVDLDGYANRHPNELSGGQKQRVAIARALIKNPEIIMADEPTGALDSKTGKQVFDTLKKLAREKLVVVVSHDRENAEIYGDRIIELADGVIISDRVRTEEGELVSQPINFFSDKLIQIKAGYELNQDDLVKINKILKNATNDTYISLDEKSNIEFSKQSATRGGGGFSPTTSENNPIKEYDPKNFKLLKSRLPIKDSIRMGASGLKLKKVRLAFTIFLSFIAFTMFGISNTASAFDMNKTALQTMHDNGERMLTVKSQGGYTSGFGGVSFNDYDESAKLTDEHFERLEELSESPVLRVVGSSNRSGSILNFFQHGGTVADEKLYYSSVDMTYLLEVPKAEDANLTPASQNSKLPSSFDEIALSDFHADFFVEYGLKEKTQGTAKTINNYSDLVGKEIIVSLQEEQKGIKQVALKISGVFKTDVDTSRWDNYKSLSTSEASLFDMLPFMQLREIVLGMGYVAPGFEAAIPSMKSESNGDGQYEQFVYYLENPAYITFGEYAEAELRQIGKFSSTNNDNLETKQRFYGGEDVSIPQTLNENEIILDHYKLNIPWDGETDDLDGYGNPIYLSGIDYIKYAYDKMVSENGAPLTITINCLESFSKTFIVKGILLPEGNNYCEALMNNDALLELHDVATSNKSSESSYLNLNNYGFGSFEDSRLYDNQYSSYAKYDSYILSDQTVYWGEGNSPRALKDNEVILNSEFFGYWDYNGMSSNWVGPTQEQMKEIFDDMLAKNTNKGKLGKAVWDYNEGIYTVNTGREIEIVGIYLENRTPIVSEALFEELLILSKLPKIAVVKLTGNLTKDRAIFDYLESTVNTKEGEIFRVHYSMSLSSLFDLVDELTFILKDVFFWIAIVFSVFAGMLLMNFIGVSVAAKKKDIGVLRAIGARSIDVFNIFWSEGNIIGLINTVLAIVALIVFSSIMNGLLGISVFVPGILQFGLIALLCFGVVLIATFLPVRKIAQKKPIDAINNR